MAFSVPNYKELDLSAEQCNRLSKVSADFWTKFKELSKENADMTDQQKAKVHGEYQPTRHGLPQTSRSRRYAPAVGGLPESGSPPASHSSRWRLRSRRVETTAYRGAGARTAAYFQGAISTAYSERNGADGAGEGRSLGRAQPAAAQKLRSDVQQKIRNDEESLLSYSIGTAGGMQIFSLAEDAGTRWAPMVLPFYAELTETAIAQRLGLSAGSTEAVDGG